jgi:hypothetical protein
MIQPYVGNVAYGYVNSLSVCLLGAGANRADLPDAGFLECLTGMPFGHTYFRLHGQPQMFFSSPENDPDTGLTQALKILGWTCQEWYGEDTAEAIALLRQAVQRSPVLVGPVDQGYLSYNPNCRTLAGTDHFVVVLAVEEDGVRLHDPAGYPCAMLPMAEFLLAWQAEQIPYRLGPYTFRSHFRQLRSPSAAEMVIRMLPTMRSHLALDPQGAKIWGEGGPAVYGSVSALGHLAQDLQGKVISEFASLLSGFALPLATCRTLQAATFLQTGDQPAAAKTLEQQAMILGEAQYFAAQQQWLKVAQLVERFATLEAQLIEIL